MDTNTKNQQIEFEVFPKDAKSNYSYLSNIKGDAHTESSSINVVFSHQSVIVILICVIMSMVASFTLGVEKGKLIAKNSFSPEKTALTTVAAVTDASQAAEKIKIQTTEKIPNIAEKPQNTAIPSMAVANGNLQSVPAAAAPIVVTKKEDLISKSGYVIQIATVKTESSAKNLSESLVKKGWSAFTKPSGKYIIVLAGNFSKKEDAQTKLKELKKTYTDCFIKKI